MSIDYGPDYSLKIVHNKITNLWKIFDSALFLKSRLEQPVPRTPIGCINEDRVYVDTDDFLIPVIFATYKRGQAPHKIWMHDKLRFREIGGAYFYSAKLKLLHPDFTRQLYPGDWFK